MHRKAWAILLCAAFAVSGRAQPIPSEAEADDAGGAAIDDPFEPDGIIPSGPFAGQRIDTSRARAALLLPPDEASRYGAKAEELAVANVQHAGAWWVARIQPDGLRDVIFHSERIPDGMGHGQIRLRFKSGSWPILVPQAPGSTRSPVRLGDFIFTADGTPPIGVEGPRKPGPLQQYLIVYRLMSLQDNLKIISASGEMHSVDQFRLPLNEQEKAAVLREALETATRTGMQTMFNLATRSCVTEALGVLDRSLSYWPPNRVAAYIFKRFPVWIPGYLFVRGLIRPGVLIPNLREEFPTAQECSEEQSVPSAFSSIEGDSD